MLRESNAGRHTLRIFGTQHRIRSLGERIAVAMDVYVGVVFRVSELVVRSRLEVLGLLRVIG